MKSQVASQHKDTNSPPDLAPQSGSISSTASSVAGVLLTTVTNANSIYIASSSDRDDAKRRVLLSKSLHGTHSVRRWVLDDEKSAALRISRDQEAMAIGATNLDRTTFELPQSGAQVFETCKTIDSLQVSQSSIMNRSHQVSTTTTSTIMHATSASTAMQTTAAVAKLRERLFRVISKVPVQVESMSHDQEQDKGDCDGTASSADQTGEGCSGKAKVCHRSNYASRPIVIKYYNEKSLYEILELHFRCSLFNETGAPEYEHRPANKRLAFDIKKSVAPHAYYVLNGDGGQSQDTEVGTRPSSRGASANKGNNNNGPSSSSMSSSPFCGLQSLLLGSSDSGWQQASYSNEPSADQISMVSGDTTSTRDNNLGCCSQQLNSIGEYR